MWQRITYHHYRIIKTLFTSSSIQCGTILFPPPLLLFLLLHLLLPTHHHTQTTTPKHLNYIVVGTKTSNIKHDCCDVKHTQRSQLFNLHSLVPGINDPSSSCMRGYEYISEDQVESVINQVSNICFGSICYV